MLKRIGKRYLAVLLAVLMLVPLFTMGASAAEISGHGVTGLTASNANNYWSWNNNDKTFLLSISSTEESGCNGQIVPKEDTLTLTNSSGHKARLEFGYTSSANGGTVTLPSGASDGRFSKVLGAGESVTVYGKSSTSATNTTTITLSSVTLTPVYDVNWSVLGQVVESDVAEPNSQPMFNKPDPTAPDYQGNPRYFLGWSADPNATRGVTAAELPKVTADVTYYAIFTSIQTFPVVDPDPEPTSFDVSGNAHIENPGRVNQNGFKLSKELSQVTEENYKITMESYSTANATMMAVTEKVPTDFVLVVDQSGSMSETDMPTGYSLVSGSRTLEQIAQGSYFIKADDGNYYRVYAVRDYLFRYYAPNYWYVGDLIDRFGENLGWFMGESETETTFDNQMYFREANADGKGVYHPITMTVRGAALTYYIRFKYTNNAGSEVLFNREEESYVGTNCPYYHNVLNGNVIGPGWGIWPVNYNNVDGIVQGLYGNDNNYTYSEIEILGAHTGMLVNYPMYDRHVGYVELRYRDVNGVEHTVSPLQGTDKAEYCNANGEAITTASGSTRYNYNNLYQATGTTSRLNALKAALTEFATAVANEKDTKTGSGVSAVDNRVAIVGFSSSGYNNTELLTGENLTIRNNNGTQKNDATASDYATALVSANNGNVGSVNAKITQAISAITANGGTQPEDGFQMAKSILDNRSVTTYNMVTDGNRQVERNTIVIFFTDGQPGDYHYSNQYSEANEVVASALPLKQDGVQVFSIGVFGESDGNPLTYNETNLRPPYNDRAYWPYMGGWMETYREGGSYYCLRRQWRPDNADYTPVANDTIFDYMSVTSSNYPDAQNFIAPSWLTGGFSGNYIAATDGVRSKSTAETNNKYYRMASNQATLVAAFMQAVTHAADMQQHSSTVVLGTNAVFRDTVNTTDFDISEATYSVYWEPITVDESAPPSTSMVVTAGERITKVDSRAVPANGVIEYSGFDYANNCVYYGKTEPGYRLVVEIQGLKPLTYNNAFDTNVGKAGIYDADDTEPTISIDSPSLIVYKTSSTYIADFNAPLIVATDVPEGGIREKNVQNGDFTRTDSGEAVYKLSSGTQQSAAGTTVAINVNYTQADTAKITGKHVEDGADATVIAQTVTVIPAGSVYYDDDLTTPIAVGDGSGYNAAVQASPTTQDLAKGVHTFTFYGTGIDVYCTTAHDGGMIQAKLEDGQTQSVRNYTEETTRYNVPTVSFRDLAPGVQHTLTLNILGSSNYKLDGIRVYNPMADQTQYAETDEQYATFINLREVMINNGLNNTDPVSVTEVAEDDYSAVFGALFVDNMNKLSTRVQAVDAETGEPRVDENDQPIMVDAYSNVFEAYQNNSPKHEVYLGLNQAVTFQLTEAAQSGKLWIGLSAPDAGTGTGRVMVNSRYPITVTSGVDMYYEIDPEWIVDGSLTIANDSMTMISVTNLKITGVESIYNAANASKTSDDGAASMALADVVPMVFEPVTIKTVRMALNGGFDPEEQDFDPDDPGTPVEPDEPDTPVEPDEPDKPAWNDPTSFLKNLFQWLLNSLKSLFSGLGGW